jgi:hypothetical protein
MTGVVAEAEPNSGVLLMSLSKMTKSLNSNSSAKMPPTFGLAAPTNPFRYQGPTQPTQGSGGGGGRPRSAA